MHAEPEQESSMEPGAVPGKARGDVMERGSARRLMTEETPQQAQLRLAVSVQRAHAAQNVVDERRML